MRSVRRSRVRSRRPQPDKEDLQYRATSHMLTNNDLHPGLLHKPDNILKLQRIIGNQAVQRLVIQRAPDEPVQANKDANSTPSIMGTITFKNRGKVEGTSRQPGHEGKIEILSINSESREVRARGREDREKEERVIITITKYVDKTTPVFANAFKDGDSIAEAAFAFVRPNSDGGLDTFHTLEFSEGLVASISNSTQEGKGIEVISIEFVKRSSG